MILMGIKSFFLLLSVFVYTMYHRRVIASGHQPTLIERLYLYFCVIVVYLICICRTLKTLALSLILLNSMYV